MHHFQIHAMIRQRLHKHHPHPLGPSVPAALSPPVTLCSGQQPGRLLGDSLRDPSHDGPGGKSPECWALLAGPWSLSWRSTLVIRVQVGHTPYFPAKGRVGRNPSFAHLGLTGANRKKN